MYQVVGRHVQEESGVNRSGSRSHGESSQCMARLRQPILKTSPADHHRTGLFSTVTGAGSHVCQIHGRPCKQSPPKLKRLLHRCVICIFLNRLYGQEWSV